MEGHYDYVSCAILVRFDNIKHAKYTLRINQSSSGHFLTTAQCNDVQTRIYAYLCINTTHLHKVLDTFQQHAVHFPGVNYFVCAFKICACNNNTETRPGLSCIKKTHSRFYVHLRVAYGHGLWTRKLRDISGKTTMDNTRMSVYVQ